MSEFKVTPEQLVAWNTEAVNAVPGLNWRSVIDAASIAIIRIATSNGEDMNYVHDFVIHHGFAAARLQPQPEYIQQIEGSLYGKPNADSVKALLNVWWDIITREMATREHQMALGSMLGLEMVAALSRNGPMTNGLRELFSMTLVEFANNQLMYDHQPLAEFVEKLSEPTFEDLESAPMTDLSAPAFAAISVLTRCVHLSGSMDFRNALHTLSAIDIRCKHYAGRGEKGALRDTIDPPAVNAYMTRWGAQLEAVPRLDHGTILSALAIEVLARILMRMCPADFDMLKKQVAGYITGGPGILDNLPTAPQENDNHAV